MSISSLNLFGLNRRTRVYLDYASLTPIDRRALAAMHMYSAPKFANPSSLYKEGVAAKKALADMRGVVADFLHAHADEIVFISGGTEANILAVEGAYRAFIAQRVASSAGVASPDAFTSVAAPHLIISSIEHSSVMEVAAALEEKGVAVTRLAVDGFGVVSLDELKKAIRLETFLISIMTVNNEIGSIQPIRDIAKVIRRAREGFATLAASTASVGSTTAQDGARMRYPLFHTDAAQAVLYEDLTVDKLGVDLLTLDAGKVYGPRGVGALYVRRDTPLEPIMPGGGQERGLRSGTENLPGIAGFAKTLEIAAADRECEAARVAALRDAFVAGLKALRSDIQINGERSAVSVNQNSVGGVSAMSPHIASVSIPSIDNEFALFQLDAAGIACSTKSSCLRDADESYVLKAIGADSSATLRFSFGRWTTKRDIARAIKAIARILSL